MSTGNDPCGIVRGPVQISFAKSVDPIFTQDITITRQARTNESDSATMGRKSIVPYGLYRADGYVSAMLAQKITKFSEEDLELLWKAIINMFEHDRSAARGKMCVRKTLCIQAMIPYSEMLRRMCCLTKLLSAKKTEWKFREVSMIMKSLSIKICLKE